MIEYKIDSEQAIYSNCANLKFDHTWTSIHLLLYPQ